MLGLRYETLKNGQLSITQINLYFLADQDFQGCHNLESRQIVRYIR